MSDDLPTIPLPSGPDPDSHPTRSISGGPVAHAPRPPPIPAGRPAGPPVRTPRSPDPGLAETLIGPYTILSVLGEGGFGVVYLAERTHPIQQRVAIKVIKPGMDSAQVVARFELERQALAVMDHPNVARVLDAGSTPSGRPYFVMEYVPGEPITAFCDRHNFDIRQRLELMGQVCDAVQHAHLKGLVHRDLKPGNIMVLRVDGAPIAKVIDFGIAKAIQRDHLAAEAFTYEGMLMGTPEYMSPEQAGGEIDIDTRTDIYALGVVLYELLTGALPFDARTLRSRGLAEIQRIIREVDPPRPSTRLGELGPSSAAIARSRKTPARSLERALRRELEWIPLKAMRKDRSRRYNTAQELRDDLGRYLKGQPLQAGPESRLYRARKFAARNRASVGAAAVVLVALVAATVVSVRFAVSERRARLSEQAARTEATTQRDVAESVNDFLNTDLLGSINPELEDPDVKVADVLDRAASRIGESLKDKPAVRARVLRTLGQSYLSIGRPEQSKPLLDQAKELDDSLKLLSADDRDRVILALNECYWRQRDTDSALALLAPAVEQRRARLGGAASNDALLAELLNSLGGLHKWAGRYDQAAGAYTEALDIRTRMLSPIHTDTLITAYNLVGVDEARGRGALFAAYSAKDEPAKERAHENLLAVRERMRILADQCAGALGPEAPTTLAARCEVAYMSNLTFDFETSIRLYSEIVPLLKTRLTAKHWRTIEACANLGDAYRHVSRHAEAAAILAETVELYRQVRGPTFPDTTAVTRCLADSLERSDQADAAGAALERLFTDLNSGNGNPGELRGLATAIADLYARHNRPEAEQAWRETASKF